MNQDGKVDQAAKDPPAGKLMLTLCALTEGAPGYRHGIITFPPSYQVACAEALKTFGAYIPADKEAITLRQAIQRKDGRHVWSIIREDTWDTALEKSGEEVGVFLPDVSPDSMPYDYLTLPRKVVALVLPNGSRIFRVVSSLQECKFYAKAISDYLNWGGYDLKFDERVVGSEAERKAYKEQISREVWSVLRDPEVLEFILNLNHNETLRIQVVETTAAQSFGGKH